MKADKGFLQAVQQAGWCIDEVHAHGLVAKCPRHGCGLRVDLSPGKFIPETCSAVPGMYEVVVPEFKDARTFLRDRRDSLRLNIAELEECIGLTKDHLAKIEPDDPFRLPNVVTFIEWAQALGYEVVLRYAGLPPKTISYITQTRDKSSVRAQRQASRRKAARLAPTSV